MSCIPPPPTLPPFRPGHVGEVTGAALSSMLSGPPPQPSYLTAEHWKALAGLFGGDPCCSGCATGGGCASGDGHI